MISWGPSSENQKNQIITDILYTIAEAENVGPETLAPRLYDVIDTDALTQLVHNTDQRVSVTFEYRSWLVEVKGKNVSVAANISDDSERYKCICHTCLENKVTNGLDQAQVYFNEHADRGCEVVLRNVASTANPLTAEMTHSNTAMEDSRQ